MSDVTDRQPVVVAERPTHGEPRPFHFPRFESAALSNGLGLITVHLPGRALVSGTLMLPTGAVDEPPEQGGVTALMARALTEGTKHRDAIQLTEAAERLGASLHAEAGWSAVLRVPARRSEEDMVLELVEGDGVVIHPGFFFDFAHEAYLVASLLPDPGEFREGVRRVLERVDV